jgi:hypothetical protein
MVAFKTCKHLGAGIGFGGMQSIIATLGNRE